MVAPAVTCQILAKGLLYFSWENRYQAERDRNALFGTQPLLMYEVRDPVRINA